MSKKSVVTENPISEAGRVVEERAELEKLRDTTANLVRLLVQEGVLSREKAQAMLGAEAGRVLGDSLSVQPAAPQPSPTTPLAQPQAPAPAPAEPTDTSPQATAEPRSPDSRRKRGQTVRVPYIPETVKNEIREQLRQDVLAQAKAERWAEPGTLPEWLDRIAWEGDLRLRYQGEYYAKDNIDPLTYQTLTGVDIGNTRTDQDLWRIRFRLGMLAKLSETLGVGVRLATGNLNNPVSTNQTLGNSGRPNQFLLDRAYLKWDPSESFGVMAGRIPNPWFWPTVLVWDEDLNFEGAAGYGRARLHPDVSGFLTVGAFPLQRIAPTAVTPNPSDKWLYGAQVGGEWVSAGTYRLKLAAALFDYRNTEGRPNSAAAPNAFDWAAVQTRQKGNTYFDMNAAVAGASALYGQAAKFRIVNLGGEFEMTRFDPFVVKLSGDYAENIGFDRSEIRARTGIDLAPETKSYQAQLTMGRGEIRDRHDWQAFVGYRHIERDAMPDGFTDSGFYNGGTNTKGYLVGGLYGLDRNVYVRLRYMSGDLVSPPINATGQVATQTVNGQQRPFSLAIDILHVDLQLRF